MIDSNLGVMQEILKNYYKNTSLGQDKSAKKDLESLNEYRLNNVVDAGLRRIFYDQVDIPALASGGRTDTFFSRNDVDWVLKRGIADLDIGTSVSLEKSGGKEKVLTREEIIWQQIFSAVQGTSDGLELLMDFPQEVYFGENESLQVGLTGNVNDGWLWFHGATIRSQLDINLNKIQAEIENSLPQTQLVPLIYSFPAGANGSIGVNAGGGSEIFSQKNGSSVLLTHVSITDQNVRLSIYDEGQNLQICDTVEAVGVASLSTNRFTTYYELPYPHLLVRGDRLKLRVVNGTDRNAGYVNADELQYLVFKGYTV